MSIYLGDDTLGQIISSFVYSFIFLFNHSYERLENKKCSKVVKVLNSNLNFLIFDGTNKVLH